MEVAIIKYNAGNVQSVLYALDRLGINAIVTDDEEVIAKADKVIFPGVGNASSAMKYLKEKNLHAIIKNLKQPVLGICLGLQLLCNYSEEGNTECLGVFDTEVKLFTSKEKSFKVPQIGWNSIYNFQSSIFDDLPGEPFVYFVHSYYAELSDETSATSNYILPYSAALQNDNFYAVQFHVEKSGCVGEKILSNFIKG